MINFIASEDIKINLDDSDWSKIASKETIKKMVKTKNAFAYDIFLDNKVIGFALFRRFNRGIFLWQYAIDKEYQHQGYGYIALKEFIEKIKMECKLKYITTTYTWGNIIAKNLYEKLGFLETDVVEEDGIHEVNMKLCIKQSRSHL